MTTQPQKKIYYLNASLLKKSSCDRLIQHIALDGLKEPVNYNDTQYGSAFHKFISRMYESGGKFDEALVAAKAIMSLPCKIRNKKDHLNEQHLVKTMFDFWEQYETSNNSFRLLINPTAICYKCSGINGIPICPSCDGKGVRPQPMVEQTFDIKVRETDDYEIHLAGTIDQVGQIINGCFAVNDYKTTSTWDIESYLAPWRLSPQLKFYVSAIRRIGLANPDSEFARIAKTNVGACITGIFLKSSKETIFKRSDVFVFKESELDEFDAMLEVKLDEFTKLINDYRANRIIMPTGMMNDSCPGTSKWKCPYFNACNAPDSIARNHVLKNNFKSVSYNPLQHDND